MLYSEFINSFEREVSEYNTDRHANGNFSHGQKMEKPDSILHSSSAKILCWNSSSRLVHSIESLLLERGCTSVVAVNFLVNPKGLLKTREDLQICDKFPAVIMGGQLVDYENIPARTLDVSTSEVDETDRIFQIPYLKDPSEQTPEVDFLDKKWKWPVLMLHLIETFGCTVEKTTDDPVLPEEFICDCLKRNLGIEHLKDCRILIYELLNNGIIEGVCQEEYKFVYHVDRFGLNLARDEFEDETEIPSVTDTISYMLQLLSRMHKIHSLEFLTLVDYATFFRHQNYSDIKALKSLIDLFCILSHHIDVSGEYLESTREQFYYQFKDRKVHLRDLREAIMHYASPCDKEGLEALLLLRWTISGEEKSDDEIISIAKKHFINNYVSQDCAVWAVPSFLRSFSADKKRNYDISISPCLSL